MFYDPERAYSPSSLLKGLRFAAILLVVFVVGVCVGNAETEEQPSSEPQQTSGVGATAIPIPEPIDYPTPTPFSIDDYPEYLGVVGDCDLALTWRGLAGVTRADYAELGRRDGCSEQRVQESLLYFHIWQKVARNSIATEDAAIALGIPTPTHEPSPTLFTDDPTGRCSASPDCALEVPSSVLEDYYRSDSSRWDLSMVEGRGAGAGKRIFTANSKTDAGYYVTWIEREGVGVQLVEMVAPLPMACSDWESFANVRYNLVDLMQLTISSPLEPRDPHNLYDLGCYLTSSNNKINLVINGVLASANYVDVEDIRLLDFTFWPCGERVENGRCQWYKS